MSKDIQLYGLGAASCGNDAFIFFRDSRQYDDTFRINRGTDGTHFKNFTTQAKISAINAPNDAIEKTAHYRLSHIDDRYYLTYIVDNGGKLLTLARSRDLIAWEKIGIVAGDAESGMIVSDFEYDGKRVMYVATEALYVAYADDPSFLWRVMPQAVLHHDDYVHRMIIADVAVIEEGIFVTYHLQHYRVNTKTLFTLHAALFDKSDPARCLWRSPAPIPDGDPARNDLHHPIGLVIRDDDALYSYWQSNHGTLVIVPHPFLFEKKKAQGAEQYELIKPTLERAENNPMIAPLEHRPWESRAVFNPAAIYTGGKIHILYRALGDNDVSVLGYATSRDGVTIEERLHYPAYTPSEWFEGVSQQTPPSDAVQGQYMSGGGGYGGCEDPKLTLIDERLYMVYVAYNGWAPPRLALTSISVDDFLNHHFHWRKPVLVSPPDIIDKSGCILPEKINGKYVIFHRVFPDILIDFVDDLDFDGKTHFLSGQYKISPREGMWDSRKVSVGAPPIKTEHGWLVIYHAVDDVKDNKYKIGAMLLDLENPTKVLYRTNKPLLSPEEQYENGGEKFGVVYPCGAVVKDDTLFVYYGGSDQFVCVASAPLTQFLTDLINHHKDSQLKPLSKKA